jgi:small subunit ribosomal protein S6
MSSVYEGMFILDPSRFSRDPETVSGGVTDSIAQNGGTVLAARVWDERKLAYPINGHKKGVYWLTYFRMPGENVVALEKQCALNSDIIRMLILKIDARIADVLVQHALEGGATTGAPAGRRSGAGTGG